MEVVHINYSDTNGGAAIAAMRLHRALREYGISSKMLVLRKSLSDSEVYCITSSIPSLIYKKYIKTHFSALFHRDRNIAGDFSYFSIGSDLSPNAILQDADVIFLHWIGEGFISESGIKKILRLGKPVYWVLHDMFPITGGCHHSFECRGYMEDCENCKYFLHKKRGIAQREYNKKQKLKKYNNLFWIAPSQWIYECAQKSKCVEEKRLYNIPNITSPKFTDINKQEAKKLLSIPENKKVILYGANNALTNQYKGFEYFVDAIKKLKIITRFNDQIEIVVFGVDESEITKDYFPFQTKYVGKLVDEYSLCVMYNAADVFALTSLAENFPLTVIESLSCKTPVVTFDEGGPKEMVQFTRMGYVIETKNTEQFANGLERVIRGEIDWDQTRPIGELCGEAAILKYINLINRSKKNNENVLRA